MVNNRLRRPTRLRRPLPQRNRPQQHLHRHRLVQHLRRRLRRHHLRRSLLLRPLLARAPRVARRKTRVENMRRVRVPVHAVVCASLHVHCRDEERVCDGAECSGGGEIAGGVWGKSVEVSG
jgi:hypothetical protein